MVDHYNARFRGGSTTSGAPADVGAAGAGLDAPFDETAELGPETGTTPLSRDDIVAALARMRLEDELAQAEWDELGPERQAAQLRQMRQTTALAVQLWEAERRELAGEREAARLDAIRAGMRLDDRLTSAEAGELDVAQAARDAGLIIMSTPDGGAILTTREAHDAYQEAVRAREQTIEGAERFSERYAGRPQSRGVAEGVSALPPVATPQGVPLDGLTPQAQYALISDVAADLATQRAAAEELSALTDSYEAAVTQSRAAATRFGVERSRQVMADFEAGLSEDERALMPAVEAEAERRADARLSGAVETGISLVPFVGAGRALYLARQPDSPGGEYLTDAERRSVAIDMGLSVGDLLIGPATKPVGIAVRGGVRRFGPGVVGGGFTPRAFGQEMTLRIPANTPRAQELAIEINRALAEGRPVVVDRPGRAPITFRPSRGSQLLHELNPDTSLYYHLGDMAPIEAGRVMPYREKLPTVEDAIFAGPEPAHRFTYTSATGVPHIEPGTMVIRTPVADDMVVIRSGFTDPKYDYPQTLQVPRDRLGALGTRVEPDPDEVALLVAGGMSRREALEAASRPAIPDALSTPGKTYEGAKEIEVTLPAAGGLAEFVGVAPDVSRRQFYLGRQAFGRRGSALYAPEGFVTPSYRQRVWANVLADVDALRGLRDARTGRSRGLGADAPQRRPSAARTQGSAGDVAEFPTGNFDQAVDGLAPALVRSAAAADSTTVRLGPVPSTPARRFEPTTRAAEPETARYIGEIDAPDAPQRDASADSRRVEGYDTTPLRNNALAGVSERRFFAPTRESGGLRRFEAPADTRATAAAPPSRRQAAEERQLLARLADAVSRVPEGNRFIRTPEEVAAIRAARAERARGETAAASGDTPPGRRGGDRPETPAGSRFAQVIEERRVAREAEQARADRAAAGKEPPGRADTPLERMRLRFAASRATGEAPGRAAGARDAQVTRAAEARRDEEAAAQGGGVRPPRGGGRPSRRRDDDDGPRRALLEGDGTNYPRVVEYDHDNGRRVRHDLRTGEVTDVGEWRGSGDGGEGLEVQQWSDAQQPDRRLRIAGTDDAVLTERGGIIRMDPRRARFAGSRLRTGRASTPQAAAERAAGVPQRSRRRRSRQPTPGPSRPRRRRRRHGHPYLRRGEF